jgi:hypothetical protein
VTSFAETNVKPAFRAYLVRLARRAYLGRLDRLSEHCLACTIRRLAPALADASDEQALAAFGVLCVDVLTVDTLASGGIPGCAMAGEAEIAYAQLRLDCTLAALVPGEAL